MRAAIPLLKRRVEELGIFDLSSAIERTEPRLESFDQKIDDTLVAIFGAETIEYKRYSGWQLRYAAINADSPREAQEDYRQALQSKIATLQTIIDLFEEKLHDSSATPASRAVRAFADLDLQSDIARASSKLFQDGHYASAVEDACKALDGLVKLRSGRFELSGTDLMLQVFSVKAPVLAYNDLKTDSDRSEQQGMMHLFAGAMLALRNPRAHELMKDDPEQAIEHLGFLSMLAKSLDRTTRR